MIYRLRLVISYWWGRYRLYWLTCPACNSSPPQPECFVCNGSRKYGPRLTSTRKQLWLNRWNEAHGRLKW